jgi:hypothetical protein
MSHSEFEAIQSSLLVRGLLDGPVADFCIPDEPAKLDKLVVVVGVPAAFGEERLL